MPKKVLTETVKCTLTNDQIKILDSLIGVLGSNRQDVVSTILTMWLYETYKKNKERIKLVFSDTIYRPYYPYGIEFDETLKEKIRERDSHRCQECGVAEVWIGKKNFRRLSIHHIDYDKSNNNQKNLISLCIPCHTKTNGNNREYWTKHFKEKIKKR